MVNDKIKYSKPELLDLEGVGEVTSGAAWCSAGSVHTTCSLPGNVNNAGGCTRGFTPLSGCAPGTSARLPYPCNAGSGIH